MGVNDGGIRPPNLPAIVDDAHAQLSDLQRRTKPIPAAARRSYEATFHFYGTLSPLLSPSWPVPSTGRLFVVRFLPSAAGAGDITLKVYKSGSALTPLGAGSPTITLPGSSTDEVSVGFDDVFLRIGGFPADSMAVETVTTSAGWSDLVVLGDFG